jgi:SAM-dependent methyltransferase
LTQRFDGLKLKSQCNICGHEGEWLVKEQGREGFLCGNCSASSRHRALIHAFGLWLGNGGMPLCAWPANKQLRILESSGRGSYPMMLKDKFEYYNTEFNPTSELIDKPFSPYADFQKLAYPAQQFDAIIASDVFEHVREDEKGFKEIFRVLKNDGVFVLTVPYDHSWSETLVRVRVEGDKDIHLLPDEYHGGGGQTLSYRSYGRDMLSRLRNFGFTVGYFDLDLPEHGVVRQPVFLAVKNAYLDLTQITLHPGFVERHAAAKASPLLPFRVFLTFKYNLRSLKHFVSEITRRLTDSFRKNPTS